MPLSTYRYTCSPCGHEFDAAGASGVYGELIARTTTGLVGLIQLLNNAAFDDVAQRLARQIGVKPDPSLLQAVFSIACDPGPDGLAWEVNRPPSCPSCGSDRMRAWTPDPSGVQGDYVIITHDCWLGLDDAHKDDRLNAELIRRGTIEA